ncbi:hypothetical protein [Caudoviricetes sp.]|nr:hypothetical protein [Caudoviricetes sp.]
MGLGRIIHLPQCFFECQAQARAFVNSGANCPLAALPGLFISFKIGRRDFLLKGFQPPFVFGIGHG